jgi:MFS family permease
MTTPAGQTPNAPRATGLSIFRHRNFALFQLCRIVTFSGHEVQKVALGYHLYQISGQPIMLGYAGLALFLPAMLFSLHAGQVADRFDRKRIMRWCQILLALGSALLARLASAAEPDPNAMLLVLGLCGTAATYYSPASQALMPSLVPREDFPLAVTWNSIIWQVTSIAGPITGGLIVYYGGPVGAYLVDALLLMLAALILTLVRPPRIHREAVAAGWRTAFEGLRYVWHRPILFSTISLDLFAVLLGGVTALLPVFAQDILRTDSFGLGLLRAAPAVGAGAMALALAWAPPMRNAGALMLISVAVFGLATIGFGLSTLLWLSVLFLAIAGAADMISVVVRHTLVQIVTPEHMRGRVSAVNLLCIRASNELGEFQSGVVAQWIGPIACAVVGGVGTIAITALYALLYPALRRVDRLDDPNLGNTQKLP